ncbi:torsin-1A-like [Hyperolius riggenbachi]|uniref:torsin-1A-like n=1 Tax=Hyperolius riggenbachi TaxID=752182 RepID=UPI0035A37209
MEIDEQGVERQELEKDRQEIGRVVSSDIVVHSSRHVASVFFPSSSSDWRHWLPVALQLRVLCLRDPCLLLQKKMPKEKRDMWTSRMEKGTQHWMDMERCNLDKSINRTALQENFNKNFFGQHLAHDMIYQALTEHMDNKNPKKPLVLSLHGWIGTGKTFVSKIIAESIYHWGLGSRFVHLSPPHSSMSSFKRLRESAKHCAASLFIFDLMASFENVNNIQFLLEDPIFHQSIFILHSYEGSVAINKVALDFWMAGKRREDICLEDLASVLHAELSNQSSVYSNSGLITKNLIDHYVPFLPMEYRHVKQCVMAELSQRRLKEDDDLASRVASEMIYFPEEHEVFSLYGCTTVASRLDRHL